MEIGVISYLLRHHDTPSAMAFLRDIGFENVELAKQHTNCNPFSGKWNFHYGELRGADVKNCAAFIISAIKAIT